jgi:hypothetical protein
MPPAIPDKPSLGRDCPKKNDCRSYLGMIIGKFKDLIGKAAPTSGCETTPDGAANVGVMIVPHEHVSQLFEEYVCYRKSQQYDPNSIAEYDTFNQAYIELEKAGEIRLLGCKGSFPTCDICNNCNDLLRNASRKCRPEQLEVILNHKRAHLAQQEIERRHMDNARELSRTLDASGQPVALFVLPDGMTERRTVVPKEQKDGHRKGKGNYVLTNRIMGVIVTCGPNIDTKILYHLDNFVGGGANLMVEVLRQVTIDVGTMLQKQGRRVPKRVYWQMDNCGENKNKGMFFHSNI